MEKYEYKIEDDGLVGQRIDILFAAFNCEWARSDLQEWLKIALVSG